MKSLGPWVITLRNSMTGNTPLKSDLHLKYFYVKPLRIQVSIKAVIIYLIHLPVSILSLRRQYLPVFCLVTNVTGVLGKSNWHMGVNLYSNKVITLSFKMSDPLIFPSNLELLISTVSNFIIFINISYYSWFKLSTHCLFYVITFYEKVW